MSWIWFGVLVILVVLEASTMALVSIWGAISALIMIFLCRTGMSVAYQVLIFMVMTLVLIFTTRPLVIASRKKKTENDGINTLVGQEVRLSKAIKPFDKGLAVSKSGVTWTVVAADGSSIPEGSVCTVVSVEGNTLSVKLKEDQE